MRRFIRTTLVYSGLLATASFAWANAVREMPLEEKSRRSDLVVIGTVTSIEKERCTDVGRCAHLQISSLLKGARRDEVVVLFDGSIAEEDPLCCQVGMTYLLFLAHVKGKGSFFESVNGPFGVYPTAAGAKPQK